MRRRVVVTGIGTVNPLGLNLEEFWKNCVAGVSGADFITRFDASKFRSQFACEVKGFDSLKYFDRKEAKKLDLFVQFALVASDEALQDSGITKENVNPKRVGVIVGSGIGGLQTFYEEVESFVKGDGTPRFSPFFIPKMILDMAPGQISIRHGFTGPNFSTVSACATSNHAFVAAMDYIRLNRADVILAGGAEAAVTIPGVGGFSVMRAMSERNSDPKTASRPFDKDRDGFVLGEGAGVLVLEELEHAKARGAKIYAEIVGGSATADAYHITAPHPEGLGVEEAMRLALEDAEMQATDVDYINVHGTSTPLGDPQELNAIIKVFGDHAYKVNISSTKSMTGHLLGAAGAVEAIACIMAIRDGVVPPTINHFTHDEAVDPKLNLTLNQAQKRNIDVAISNGFGFGGKNAVVVMKKYQD